MAMSMRSRFILVILMGALLPITPAIVLSGFGYPGVILSWALAALGGSMATSAVGVRLGLAFTGWLALFSILAYYAGQHQNWWLAGIIMAVFAFGYGYTTTWGVSSHLMIAVIAVDMITATAGPIVKDASIANNALLTGLVVLVAGLWGTLIGFGEGRLMPRRPSQGLPIRTVRAFALCIAVILGIAMAVVIERQWQHGGAWFVLTLVIVIQPDYLASTKKALQRALGTTIGFGIGFVVIALVDSQALMTGIAFALLIISMVFIMRPKSPYWVFVMFLTPAIVLLESKPATAMSIDTARLGFTLLGVAVALVLAAIAYPFYRHGIKARGAGTTGAAVAPVAPPSTNDPA